MIFCVEMIRLRNIKKIILPESLRLAVLEAFRKLHPNLQPRHQRDFVRLYSLIYANALLNSFNRETKNEDTISATAADVKSAFDLYRPIMEANEAGVNPNDYEIFRDVIVTSYESNSSDPEWAGLTYGDIAREYSRVYKRTITQRRLVDYTMKALLEAGLVTEAKHPKDRRKSVFVPAVSGKMLASDAFELRLPLEDDNQAMPTTFGDISPTKNDTNATQEASQSPENISPDSVGTTAFSEDVPKATTENIAETPEKPLCYDCTPPVEFDCLDALLDHLKDTHGVKSLMAQRLITFFKVVKPGDHSHAMFECLICKRKRKWATFCRNEEVALSHLINQHGIQADLQFRSRNLR